MTQARGELEPAEKLAPPPAVQQFLEQYVVDMAVRRDEVRRRCSTWPPEEPVATSPEDRRGARAAAGRPSR